MHTDYLGHTPSLVVSQCVRDAQVIERMNSGLLSRATASNSCRKNIGLLKLTSDSTLCSKVRNELREQQKEKRLKCEVV